MTPVGRALYAAFKRADIATSSITGNPTFMTNVGSFLYHLKQTLQRLSSRSRTGGL